MAVDWTKIRELVKDGARLATQQPARRSGNSAGVRTTGGSFGSAPTTRPSGGGSFFTNGGKNCCTRR